MKPEDLTPEELKIWSSKKEQAFAQVVRLFKSDMELTPEEEVIWNNATLTELQRVWAIQEIRIKKERAEYVPRKKYYGL